MVLQGFEMKTDLQSVSHSVLIACNFLKSPGSLSFLFVEYILETFEMLSLLLFKGII